MPKGLLKFYHVFVSYRWGVFDTELAKAIFSILCVTIISGGRQVQVFLDRNRLEDGRDFSADITRALGVTGWDVNDASGESSSHGGASIMHAQAKWKQKLFKLAVNKTIECVERAVDTAASGASCTPDVVPPAANHAVMTRGADAEIQEQPLGAEAPAHAAGGMVRGDSSLKREISQLKRKEEEARMQAELARMDAEIERARKDAEMERKEAENKELLMQLEIERLRNQQPMPQPPSACCSVS